MQNNVISLEKSKIGNPNDLITFKNCAAKHGCSVSYIYKLYYSGKIKRYKKGQWKVSYSEVVEADRNN